MQPQYPGFQGSPFPQPSPQPAQGFGPPPGPPPAYGAPPPPTQGFAQPGSQGYPQQAPQAFGPPPGPPQYAPPPQYPQAPQPGGYGAPAFVPQVNSLSEHDPDLPLGDHVGVLMASQIAGQAPGMLVVVFRLEQSNNPQVPPGTLGAWKRGMFVASKPQASNQIVSNAIAGLAVPLSGRAVKDCDLPTANRLVGEFMGGFLDGQPIVGRRVRISCRQGKPHKKIAGAFYTETSFSPA